MTRFQKLTLLILALILVAVLALVFGLLILPEQTQFPDIIAVNEATQTAAAIEGATQASIEFGSTLGAATQTALTGFLATNAATVQAVQTGAPLTLTALVPTAAP